MRKKKGPAFKMKSGNKTAFKMMGAKSPVKRAGGFIIDVDDLGNPTSRRAKYDDVRAAEEQGKTVKYTNKEFDKRRKEDYDTAYGATTPKVKKKIQEDINRQNKEANRKYQAKTGGSSKTDKQSEFTKTQKIDAIAQKEIEGRPLSDYEKRMLEASRALGTDTDQVTKTPKSLGVNTGDNKVETVEKYPGAVYGLPAYARQDARYTGSIGDNVRDYKNLSDYDFEKKYGYPKGK